MLNVQNLSLPSSATPTLSANQELLTAMAAEEPQQLAFVPEVVLKKRKSNERFAIIKKQQLEDKLKKYKKYQLEKIIRPEQLIKEYRDQELDFVQMKTRVKRPRSAIATPSSELLFVLRIHGKNDIHPKTKKTLYNLRLRKLFSGVFVKTNEGILEKLQKVEPFVTYGYPNLKTVKDLIFKKGYARVGGQKVPLTDNTFIEQELGKHGILCIEDIVHEIANVGPHFKEVTNFLWPFVFSRPDGLLHGKKKTFKNGGDSGNREDGINELVQKMN